MIMYQGNTENR